MFLGITVFVNRQLALFAVAKDDKLFDYEIVNDDLESAYKQFVNALREDLTLLQRSKQWLLTMIRQLIIEV